MAPKKRGVDVGQTFSYEGGYYKGGSKAFVNIQ